MPSFIPSITGGPDVYSITLPQKANRPTYSTAPTSDVLICHVIVGESQERTLQGLLEEMGSHSPERLVSLLTRPTKSRGHGAAVLALCDGVHCIIIPCSKKETCPPCLVDFLRNKDRRCTFVGMSLTITALRLRIMDIAIQNGWEFGPFFKHWMSEKRKGLKPLGYTEDEAELFTFPSLRAIFCARFADTYIGVNDAPSRGKDQALKVDWDSTTITSAAALQLAMDAWMSSQLGSAITTFPEDVRNDSFFTTIPLAMNSAKALIKCIDDSLALDSRAKSSFRVAVTDIQVGGSQLKVKCGAYGSRLRQHYPVSFTTFYGFYTGRVQNMLGRTATVELENATSGSVASLWSAHKAKTSLHFEVISNNFGDVDQALNEARVLARRTVRALKQPASDSQSGTAITGSSDHLSKVSLAMSLMSRDFFEQDYECHFPARHKAIIEKHGASLNSTQRQTLGNAFRFRVSACRGPPGTGKTRTISAIAESFRDAGKRVLIMAPANAATQRALECIVDAGYTSVVLLVSEEYYFEWHEDSYHTRLQNHVVTPRRSKKKADNVVNGYDLGRWATEEAGIVILTHGAAVSNLLKSKRNSSAASWASVIRKIVNWNTIESVILDESSQLWEGHSLGLFSKLSHAKHFVIVGDENQLAPYGSDQNVMAEKATGFVAAGSSSTPTTDDPDRIGSLFDLVIRHPRSINTSEVHPDSDPTMLPVQMLQSTYRLPHSIGNLISNALYGGRLRVDRNPARDEDVRCMLQRANTHLITTRKKLTIADGIASTLMEACIANSKVSQYPSIFGVKDGRTCWVDLAGTEAKLDNKSSYNVLEADIVGIVAAELDYAFFKVHHQNGGHGEALRVIVISPYEAQRKRIEGSMAERLVEIGRFSRDSDATEYVRSSKFCNNIDGFQGQEADIVLVSLVRTKSVGFLNDERRANVMLSRCRHGLFVFGHLPHWSSQTSAQLVAKVADMCISQELVFNLSTRQSVTPSVNRPAAPLAVTNTNTLTVDRVVRVEPGKVQSPLVGTESALAQHTAVVRSTLPTSCTTLVDSSLIRECESFVAASPNRVCELTTLASAMVHKGRTWTGRFSTLLMTSPRLTVYHRGSVCMVTLREHSGTSIPAAPAPLSSNLQSLKTEAKVLLACKEILLGLPSQTALCSVLGDQLRARNLTCTGLQKLLSRSSMFTVLPANGVTFVKLVQRK